MFLLHFNDDERQKQELMEEMLKRESYCFKKQIRGSWWRFWSIFHVADACYNFHDKILDLSKKKAEENTSCVWHIDYPCRKPCMWRDCGLYKQWIYTVSLAQKSLENTYLFIRTCLSALVWLSMSSSGRSECLGREGPDTQSMCLEWVTKKPRQHWCSMCVALHSYCKRHIIGRWFVSYRSWASWETCQQVYWTKNGIKQSHSMKLWTKITV